MNQMYCVLNPNGTYAGIPCETWEEARELAAAAPDRTIYRLEPECEEEEEERWPYVKTGWDDDAEDEDYLLGNEDDDCGFDPYLGCYTDDC